jgi:Thioredoxin-like
MRVVAIVVLVGVLALSAVAQGEAEFPGVKQWENAVHGGDPAALRNLYSTYPPARLVGDDKKSHDISEEIDFWSKGAGRADLRVLQRDSGDQQGLHLVSLTISFKAETAAGPRTRYVLEDQAWQMQGDTWRIVLTKHSGIVKMPQPSRINSNLYPPNVDARAEIKLAMARAKEQHKRVILVFGANWCYDCHVLDYALHQPDLAKVVVPNFIVVHVDIGEGKLNNDIAAEYKTPLEHGVPALAVLDSAGKVLYSDQHGEFEKARSMDPDELMAFLEKWKP